MSNSRLSPGNVSRLFPSSAPNFSNHRRPPPLPPDPPPPSCPSHFLTSFPSSLPLFSYKLTLPPPSPTYINRSNIVLGLKVIPKSPTVKLFQPIAIFAKSWKSQKHSQTSQIRDVSKATVQNHVVHETLIQSSSPSLPNSPGLLPKPPIFTFTASPSISTHAVTTKNLRAQYTKSTPEASSTISSSFPPITQTKPTKNVDPQQTTTASEAPPPADLEPPPVNKETQS